MSATTPAGFHHGFPLGDLRRQLRARTLEMWGMMAAAPWWQRLLAAATAGVLAGWAFGGGCGRRRGRGPPGRTVSGRGLVR